MRLRGLIFERFATFERAEVSFCAASGAPLDTVVLVGDSGAGKTALLQGVGALLSEAVGAGSELSARYARHPTESTRCRLVFDDSVAGDPHDERVPERHAGGGRLIVTLEKVVSKDAPPSPLRGNPPDVFDRWRRANTKAVPRRVAFSSARGLRASDGGRAGPDDMTEVRLGESAGSEIDWLVDLSHGPHWGTAVRALDGVLWPHQVRQVGANGELVFTAATGLATPEELGGAFSSVLHMTLELLRLSVDRPREELVFVVDDIDVHLHPRWQARIIGDLRRAFPHVQLVVSTHSPFVAASVEPHQVFRLDRGEANEGGRVLRVADRIQRGAPSSSVMELAFGTPDLPGPRWVHVPEFEIRREILRALEGDLPRGAVVYAFPDVVHVRDVRDAFGEQILPKTEGATGHVFFVDYEPGAPWGHPCAYVFRTGEGRLSRNRAIWPPPNLDRFIAIGRR
ncbi:MAG TPA: AAA family ATPase [Labilithrix sp.]|nr:AAA family ATPase [Labilithrix sp.]